MIIRVDGLPVTQGSKSQVRTPAGYRLIDVHQKELREWRRDIEEVARAIAGVPKDAPPYWPAPVPIVLIVEFRMQRPKNVPRARRGRPSTRPDLDKLLRAAYDAITGVIYHDDGQVCRTDMIKRYTVGDEPPGITIIVDELPEEGELWEHGWALRA